jgi:hypothetical protein
MKITSGSENKVAELLKKYQESSANGRVPYYWQIEATYGDYEVQKHVLAGYFRVQQASTGEVFRSGSEQQAHYIAQNKTCVVPADKVG